jgi:uncharacterized damage-inducible protein DinB
VELDQQVPDQKGHPMTIDSPTVTNLERTDLVNTLGQHRDLLLRTALDLTDAQARLTPTASQLCVGGIVKHVTLVEEAWVRFIQEGPESRGPVDEAAREAHAAGFRMTDGETLPDLIARYQTVARRTDELVAALPSLDASHPLPEAPWFEPGARWSARRVLLHIVAETAQHAGHADIIRETIDGAKSMG